MATLKLKFGVISTDEHAQETPDLWTSRMSKAKFGDDIPHLGEMPDGTHRWFFRGKPAGPRIASGGVATTPRLEEPRRWEKVPKSAYVPSERIKAMDLDRVDTHTFFPDIAGITNNNFQKDGDPEYRIACIQAYNDWLADEWTAYTPRFISQCIVPMWDVSLAVAELRRAVKKGHKGLIWHGAPEVLGLPHFNDPHWDPLYAAVQELEVPLCLHLGAVPILPAYPGYKTMTARAMSGARSVASQLQVVANILYCGVFDRFPRMKAVSVESGIGWIPYLLETADHNYENFDVAKEGLKTKPSDVFRRNMWANFWFEQNGMQNRHAIGVDKIIYETDFPHPTSTWPDSVKCREMSLKDVPAHERKMMLMDNAIKLYKLDVDTSALVN